MIRFLTSFAVAGLALFAWNWTRPTGFVGNLAVERTWRLATLFVFAPLLSAWFTIGIAKYFRPSTLFDAKSPPSMAQLVRGFLAGLLSMALAVCATALFDSYVSDMAIMILSSICGTLAATCFSSKFRPGHCARCDYDLRTSIAFGRCPECGLAI